MGLQNEDKPKKTVHSQLYNENVYLFIVHRPIFLQQMRHKEIVHMSKSEKKNQKNPSLDVTL